MCFAVCFSLSATVLNPPQTLLIGTQSRAMVFENGGKNGEHNNALHLSCVWNCGPQRLQEYAAISFLKDKERKTELSQKWKVYPVKIATAEVCCLSSGCSENQFTTIYILRIYVSTYSDLIVTGIKNFIVLRRDRTS